MPLGISESTLKSAYGPIDFSGVYKSIDAISKRAYEEEKLQKQALQKEYYTNLAVLNKDMNGMNPNDNTEFMSHYNKYKTAQQKLIANPRLIERNPEEYGKLVADSNESYGNASQLASASKATYDEMKKMYTWAKSNNTKLVDGALEKIAKLANYKTKDIIDGGLLDIDKYKYQGPDFEKVGKDFDTIRKTPKTLGRKNTYGGPDLGYSVYSEYEIPDIPSLQSNINQILGKYSVKDMEEILSRYDTQIENVRKAYEELPDSVFKDYKSADGVSDRFQLHDSPKGQTVKPYINFDDPTAAGKLNAFLLANNILNIQNAVPAKGRESKTEYVEGEVGKKKILQNVALPLQLKLMQIKQNYALARQRQGYLDKRALVQLDKETGAQMNLIFDLIKSKKKIDIQYGDDITEGVVDDVLDELNSVIGKVKPKDTNVTKTAKGKKLY